MTPKESLYRLATLEMFQKCAPESAEDLELMNAFLQTSLETSVSMLLGIRGEPSAAFVGEYFGFALHNLVWLAMPGTEGDSKSCNMDNALTTVSAMALAKSYSLGEDDPVARQACINEYIGVMLKCYVVAVTASLTVQFRGKVGDELVDSIQSEFMDRVSEVNQEFVDRWTGFLSEKYGIRLKAKKANLDKETD